MRELALILKIKQVKKGDALKYLLKGLKGEDQGKLKNVSIQDLVDRFQEKIGLDNETSERLARFLVEVPNEEGKVEKLENQEFEGQTHNQATKIKRKVLHEKFMALIDDYQLLNGFAITNMLSRI